MDKIEIKQLILDHEKNFLCDLRKVMQVRSVKAQAEAGKPFGAGPKKALELVLSLAESYGFETKNVGDAVGYAQWGDGEDYIGILGHLDVVPEGAGWSVPPIDLTEKEDKLYGRGVLDNKGPIFSCLYGLKLLKDAGVELAQPIRILFGTDEESGSEDIPIYLAEERPPVFGFTPDCKYPAVYGERGIVSYELRKTFAPEDLAELGVFTGDQFKDHVPDLLSVTFQGKTYEAKGRRTPTNAPELGENAITLLAGQLMEVPKMPAELQVYFRWIFGCLHQKHYGEGLGIAFEDADSGKLILAPYELQKEGDALILKLAMRYPVSCSEEEVTAGLERTMPDGGTLEVIRRIKGTMYPKDAPGVQVLSKVYEEITGMDGTPVTTTGATYARSMPNIIAFGPSFPGQKGIAHNKDEYMDKADLILNMEIYMHAMTALANMDL